jgi:hypothetical protein
MQPAKINFYKVRGVGEIINATSEFISENFKPLFKSVLLLAGPFVLLTSIFLGLFQYDMLAIQAKTAAGEFIGQSHVFSAFGKYYSLAMIFSMLSFFFLSMVAYQYITLYVQNDQEEITTKMIWSKIKQDWWLIVKTILGLMFTSLVIYFALALFVVVIAVFGGAFTAIGSYFSPIIGVIIALAAIIGFFAFALALFAPLSLIFNIRINERLKFFSSISRCYNLASGQKIKTILVIFLCMVIQMTLSFIFMAPVWLKTIFELNGVVTSDYNILTLIGTSVMTILSYLLGVVFITAISFQYYNLLERKESTGLKMKVQSFGNQESSETTVSSNEDY